MTKKKCYNSVAFITDDERGLEFKVTLELAMNPMCGFGWNAIIWKRQFGRDEWDLCTGGYPDSIVLTLGRLKDDVLQKAEKSFSDFTREFKQTFLA